MNPPDAENFKCSDFNKACGDGMELFSDDFAGSLDGAFDADQDIPTVSAWGLLVMVLLVLTAGTLVIARWRAAATLLRINERE